MNDSTISFRMFFMVLFMFFSMNVIFAQENNEKEDDKTEEKPSERDEDRIPFSDRLFMGGNFQLSFGNITIIDVSPTLGVRLSEQAQVGVGVTYQYYRQKAGTYSTFYQGRPYTYTVDKYQTSIYGARVFGRYFLVPTMFGHVEAEALSYSYENITDFGYERRRAWIPGVFIGGGFSQPMGGRGALNMTVLYNVAYNELRSPYNSPWVIRMGFTL